MFKYIKWELLNYAKKNYKIGLVLVAIFLLALVFPIDLEGNLIWFPFMFSLVFLACSMFFMGTKLIINTYKSKTFLLESMISYSPSKLLLSKYLIAIILNIFYGVLLLIGLAILFYKVENFNLFAELIELLSLFSIFDIIKLAISLVIYSVSFTSLVTMVYILSKCLNPLKRGSLVIGMIFWWIIQYIQQIILIGIIGRQVEMYFTETGIFLIVNIINLIFIAVYYFITVKLIQNKLEIYS